MCEDGRNEVQGRRRGGPAAAAAGMSVARPSGHRPGASVAASRDGPLVGRIRLGAQLRRLRESHAITPAEAGYRIRASPSKISRLEHGRAGLKERDIADLLALYGVEDDQQRAALLTLAEQASARPWWARYGEVVPGWFARYLGLEQAAAAISAYEVQFVPGLLQTADYARAVILLGHPRAPAGQIEQRVQLRLARQQLLAAPDPPTIQAVVDEAALRRPLGGPKVMRAQLTHLTQLAGQPGITLQIMPLPGGGHPAAGGSFTIVRFAEPELPDIVYLEQLTSAIYLQKRDDIGHYLQIMDRLSTQAEPAARTADVLRQMIATI
jgi:transcriptional regulator with XRE-family HTH domain